MKNKFIFLSTLLIILSSNTFADPTYKNAELLIQKMWDSFIDGDIDAFSQTMSKDEDMVTFGTDASERWDSWQELENSVALQFDAFDVISVERKNKSLKISNSGNTAWFSETVDWEFLSNGNNESVKDIRYTGVMEYRNGQWKIVQFHCSVGVAGQVIEY
tara:strand:- start:570 stop:1049 length:480 start_codon:yes stop_codon:yes gene_type:complete